MTDDFTVTLQHASTAPSYSTRPGLCHRGMRRALAHYGLDWLRFVREGLPASELLATGDAIIANVVEHARREVALGR